MDGGCGSGSEGVWSLQLVIGVLATLMEAGRMQSTNQGPC